MDTMDEMDGILLPMPHTSRYRVELFDVNAWSELSSISLLRFLQQAASDASAAVGFDYDWYGRQGTAWFIRHTQLEILSPVPYRQEVEVRTWVSDIRRVRSQRRYEVLHASATVARGSSDWVYVDLARGVPLQPPSDLQHALMPQGIAAAERTARRRLTPPPTSFTTQRRVELAELDSVAHVNNARYMAYLEQLLWDFLAACGWRIELRGNEGRLLLAQVDIEYLEAATYGDVLEGHLWVEEIGATSFRVAQLLTCRSRSLVQASTVWRWSAGTLPDKLRQALAASASSPAGAADPS